ncbi:hypothetical protein FRB90_011136 [Tulasnella sp. 427]|nr:hypothetical protein FRB90_011136 [Tulasnella sp. 427]
MPSEHPKYGNASYMVFLVEDNLVHIPIRRLKQSQDFLDMIEEAHTGMESELISGDPNLDFTQWVAALHLATMWNFDEARENIISHMDQMTTTAIPIDRVDTLLKFNVEKWLYPT